MRLLILIAVFISALWLASAASAQSVGTISWAPGPSLLFTRVDSSQGSTGTFIYTSSGPRRLTGRLGSRPVWSPTGEQIAVDYTHGIAVLRPDGSGLRLVARDVALPSWSPDGRWIAFYFIKRSGPGIMRSDGSGIRQVGITRSDILTPIAWSPDSTHLVFGSTDLGQYVVPIDGSRRQRPRIACPEWGPHGELAYLGGGRLTIVLRDGSRRRVALTRCPTWSPNGRLVAAFGRRNPLIANVRTGRRRQVLVPAFPGQSAAPEDLAWSPDSRRLAFLWPVGNGLRAQIFTVRAAGGRARRLT
jgi:Tol biopolymer transport system component